MSEQTPTFAPTVAVAGSPERRDHASHAVSPDYLGAPFAAHFVIRLYPPPHLLSFRILPLLAVGPVAVAAVPMPVGVPAFASGPAASSRPSFFPLPVFPSPSTAAED
jgi:hypothetical protein